MCVFTLQALDLGLWSDKSGVGQLTGDVEDVARNWYPGNLGAAVVQVDQNYEDICVLCRYSLEEKFANLTPTTLPSLQQLPSPLTGGDYPNAHGCRDEARLCVLLSKNPPLRAYLQQQRLN